MELLHGIGGSVGCIKGNALVKQSLAIIPEKFTVSDYAGEEKRFRTAQNDCETRILKIKETMIGDMGEEAAEIFDAYQTILNDESFFKKALKRVESEKLNIEYLVYDECLKVIAIFAGMDDPYLRERAVDIENVCNELVRSMLGMDNDFDFNTKNIADMIIVADDLTPSETVKMDKSKLRGFVTQKGGATSHTVILAKALGIPAIVGVKNALSIIKENDIVLLDAFSGTVTVNPDKDASVAFQLLCDKNQLLQDEYTKNLCKPAVTLDGFAVNVNINSGDSDSIKGFDSEICDGIGLFRTEFLYMDLDDYPSEQVQFQAYKSIAQAANGKEVIIRTLDIGGDKQVAYMNFPKEDNPFLGYRAIRMCLDQLEIFHTQLRAILRASVFGNIKIMFPMIINLEELKKAKECVEKAKSSLAKENIAFNKDIKVGIMIETPAAALLSDNLAMESDFFSIGSNDLIQYITATDRMNEAVAHLYDNCNLSVLRAVRMVAQNAGKASIPWGICGEVASEDRLIAAWVAMGVGELSVAPSQVGKVKHIICKLDRQKLIPQIEKILSMGSIDMARAALDGILHA